MFYSEAILSRRGPLAKVWLAAHMERKLSKTQTLQTDIEQAADAIMGQEVEVMALRLSGQLLLGVVRIYSRKAKYLLDDCNEALLKIKMAFRPGVVDMTEDQLAVNRNAITLQSGNLDLDVLLPDINWDIDFEDRIAEPQGHHVARQADITLQTADDLQFDLDDPGYGFDLGPSDGIGSQDFGELDLGLDFGDGPVSVIDGGVEVGRDAPTPRSARESLDSRMMGKGGEGEDFFSNRSREPSEHPFGADMDVDMGFGPDMGGMDIDLGIDFGDRPLSDREKTPEQTRSPSRMSAAKAKRKPKEKKQIIDSVTELTDGPGARAGRGLGAPVIKDVSNILAEHPSLPRSAIVMRLMEIREDPLAYFLPTKVTPEGTFFLAGPPGLAPELSDLFMRPLQTGLPSKKRGASPDKAGRKKPRVEGSIHEDELVEQARRDASIAPSIALASEALGGRASMAPDGGFDFGDMTGGLDEFQMDVGGEFPVAHDELGLEQDKGAATEQSRSSTPAVDGEEGEETYADLTCPIASFDVRPSPTQAQEAAGDGEGTGYSKNTVKALGIIRKELKPEDREDDEERVMSFRRMTEKASRRAASAFFFELLVLGTRDCVKLSQSAAFENIEVRAKDKLWERQRHGSIAPSIASATVF
ncbi:Rec8 like protein-domain-containing protein [Suillus subaureus]|uniref:Rec8 like protein-domain-containing protein n=1 Tax=Suillus subaureus TaxID=48587 RepID=A0A9P7J982_9AGAM|nr:Rec8 like protein-domain-containing protein [Suillus subaureus]KAG1809338.1 Rec8 like protein-domain-containing protein [Suillus subaureus]